MGTRNDPKDQVILSLRALQRQIVQELEYFLERHGEKMLPNTRRKYERVLMCARKEVDPRRS